MNPRDLTSQRTRQLLLMKKMIRFSLRQTIIPLATVGVITWVGITGFKEDPVSKRIKKLDPAKAVEMAKAVEALVKPQLAEGLSLSLWGVDSLVSDPIGIDIDDFGRLYYTRTNRQKNSEFDIRGHQDWEIESNRLQTVEDKRAFLHRVLSPANSKKNEWLKRRERRRLARLARHDRGKRTGLRLEDTNNDGVADLSKLVVEDFHDETNRRPWGASYPMETIYT